MNNPYMMYGNQGYGGVPQMGAPMYGGYGGVPQMGPPGMYPMWYQPGYVWPPVTYPYPSNVSDLQANSSQMIPQTWTSASTCSACGGQRMVSCLMCNGTGRYRPSCNRCKGSGKGRTKNCSSCKTVNMMKCMGCHGQKQTPCIQCNPVPLLESTPPQEGGKGEPPQKEGKGEPLQKGGKGAKGKKGGKSKGKDETPPPPGMTIETCSAGDLARLKILWESRGGAGVVEAAWKVDNPLRTYAFTQRRAQQRQELGNKEPDGLEGFHGTHPEAVISICETGFDKNRRSGQVFGAGEYFAKDPDVSVGYCEGGSYMLVCRLTLGYPSSTPVNKDGDHIWVPEKGYYVIKEPDQVLPQFIIRYSHPRHYMYSSPVQSAELESVLSKDRWTTKAKEEIKPVPPQRWCYMKRDFAKALWMGFLHAHIADDKLESDIRRFLNINASDYTDGMKIQILKAHFKKAHVILKIPMPRDLVHRLNKEEFTEDGNSRTLCVDDSHGSPGQQCPRTIAGYCRGHNLWFTNPCWCDHPAKPTVEARFQKTLLDRHSAKMDELLDRFKASAPFHDGHPKVIAISQITNKVLSICHEEYRQYLRNKHHEEPVEQELYHGTNNNILDTVYQHGLQPPSDTNASERCPVSGGKGLCTTLCSNDCEYCTEPHQWSKCHMFGLGIYLADIAQKSHRYCSQPRIDEHGRRVYRIVVCSVLGKSFLVEGHLKSESGMHDVVNVRALDEEMMNQVIEPCRPCHTDRPPGLQAFGAELADNLESAEKSDLIFVKGLGGDARRGYSVCNSEFIAFHPYQCLPRYEIEYILEDESDYDSD